MVPFFFSDINPGWRCASPWAENVLPLRGIRLRLPLSKEKTLPPWAKGNASPGSRARTVCCSNATQGSRLGLVIAARLASFGACAPREAAKRGARHADRKTKIATRLKLVAARRDCRSRHARSGRVDSWRNGASCTYESLAGLRKPPAPASETRAARASPLSTRVLREHVVRLWRCFGLTSAPITHFTSRRLEKTRQFWTKTGHFWTKTMRKWTSGQKATIFRVVLGRRVLFGCRLRRSRTPTLFSPLPSTSFPFPSTAVS
jgi:hypothetical protein